MTEPVWPFSFPTGWGTEIDDAVEIRAVVDPFPVDPWREFPVYKLRVGRFGGRVSLMEIGPPSWDAVVILPIGGTIRDLGWFYTAAEGKDAVEQVINELAAET
jgi:hypothetical protein